MAPLRGSQQRAGQRSGTVRKVDEEKGKGLHPSHSFYPYPYPAILLVYRFFCFFLPKSGSGGTNQRELSGATIPLSLLPSLPLALCLNHSTKWGGRKGKGLHPLSSGPYYRAPSLSPSTRAKGQDRSGAVEEGSGGGGVFQLAPLLFRALKGAEPLLYVPPSPSC